MDNNAIYLQRWLSLFEDYPADNALKVGLYRDLRACYAEPHRAYHTFEHIKACLWHLDQVSNSLEQAFEVELALWLHDVIYDPQSANNEIDSAFYADQQLQRLNLPRQSIQQIHDFIMVTRHPSKPLSDDEKMLVDIDLSIIGADTVIFTEYESNIRQEYQSVEQTLYCNERIKILQKFLAQKSIYQTDYFFQHREKKARSNLKRLIIKLCE